MPEQPSNPSHSITVAAASIGAVSALASGTFGYQHAKSVYEAAQGTNAGLADYITVAQSFWDGLPVAVAVCLVVGFVSYGVWNPGLPYLAVLVAVVVLGYAGSVDPAHLVAYQRTVASGVNTPTGLMGLWFATYGALAATCAVIAGVGVGHAAGVIPKTS